MMIKIIAIKQDVVVTRDMLDAVKSPRGGITKAQLAILGVGWPPPHGWQKHIVNQMRVSADEREQLFQLRRA